MSRAGVIRSLGLFVLVLAASAGAGEVDFTLLQFNDVYEIVPPRDGQPGGLARVAAIRDRLEADHPNLLTVLAGDFLSPSVMSRAAFEGKPLAGRQMVMVLNALKPDLVTFGNHEFDLRGADFLDRMDESRFDWVSSNVSAPSGVPFHRVPRSRIKALRGADGSEVRVAFLGLTIDLNQADYVRYGNPIAAARAQVEALRGRYDVLVALTHLRREDDLRLAEAVPEIDLILGGHEHVASFDPPDPRRHAPIAKADANVKTVFVHELSYSTDARTLRIRSRLEAVGPGAGGKDERQPATAEAVDLWTKRGFEGLRAVIRKEYPQLEARLLDHVARKRGAARLDAVDFEAPFVDLPVTLNGLERDVRERRTNLTVLLTDLMRKFLPDGAGPRMAVLNSGTIRIDDEIPVGPARLYDVYRVLPYKTIIYRATMTGELLKKLLDAGLLDDRVRGEGAYLQVNAVDRDESDGTWIVGGKKLDPKDSATTYRVAINDFLLRGGETQYRSILPSRGDADLEAALSLDKDGVAIDKGPDNRLDLLSALVDFLIDVDDKDPAAKKGAFPAVTEPSTPLVAEVPPGTSFRFELACGLAPAGDGYPGPAQPTPPLPRSGRPEPSRRDEVAVPAPGTGPRPNPPLASPSPSPPAQASSPVPTSAGQPASARCGWLAAGSTLAALVLFAVLVGYAKRGRQLPLSRAVAEAPIAVAIVLIGASCLFASFLLAS